MEIDEHLKYTLCVTAFRPLQLFHPSLTPISACNSTLVPEPANPWSRAGRPTTSCNRCKAYQPTADAAGSVRERDRGKEAKRLPRKGNPKAFSSTHHATKEKKENFKIITRHCPKFARRKNVYYDRRNLTAQPFSSLGGCESSCWGAGNMVLLYYTYSAGK